jgi:lantibiotic leader peptide-processing serine protease
MRRFTLLSAAGALALAACGDQPTAPLDAPGAELAKGKIADSPVVLTHLVRFSSSGVPDGFAGEVGRLGGELIFVHRAGIAAVAGLDSADAAALAAFGGVAGVDLDAFVQLNDRIDESNVIGKRDEINVGAAGTTDVASPTNPAGSFFHARQWNMRAVAANAAWAAGQLGKPTVRVGILDTGIDYLHPDLYGRVDLSLSRSYLSRAENARVQSLFPGAHPVADLNYHGTHVAATVASNGLAAAGVTSQVTLVGLKVCAPGTAANGFRGTCPTSGTLAAILDAADMGLDVINMSLGGAFQRVGASAEGGFGPSFIATINQVMNYARSKGTLIVVSAGNDRFDLGSNRIPDGSGGYVLIPGLYASYCDAPATLCVSATGPTAQASVNGPWTNVDALASYSNFGLGAIDVAAPGGNVSSVWAACSGFTIHPALLGCRSRFYDPASGAWSASVVGLGGTSMAAPHVTGTAAIIAGRVGHNPSQIEAELQQSADDLGLPGADAAYGKGRINVARAAGVN